MKKKIAVFANGWISEIIYHYMKGLTELLPDGYADFHIFLSHDAFNDPPVRNNAESAIYSLPVMSNYDGAIIFGPGFNFKSYSDNIIERCKKANLPIVCIGCKYEDTVRIFTDNYEGMRMVMEHLIDVHGVKSILFMAGAKDNDDSNDRLRAVADVMKEHGLPFTDGDIIYTNWMATKATDYLKEHYSNGEKLPDAIVSANDNSAVFISLALEDIGYECPKDVIVTGFDGTNRGRSFYPSLTTATQPFYEMGIKTAECFMDIFAGKRVEDEYYVPCKFTLGESCGCDASEEADAYRRNICRYNHKGSVLSDFQSYRVHYMASALLKSNTYETLGPCLREFFYKEDSYEGNPFYIFMDPEFEMYGEREIEDYPKYKMLDAYDMLVGKNGSIRYETIRCNIADGIVPESEDETKNHFYVVMPLYNRSYVCGYVVMADNLEYFDNAMFTYFKMGFNRVLPPYKKNLLLSSLNNKLSELMNTDTMTSTRNRTSYESFKTELQRKVNAREVGSLAFVMFDINNLKMINDTYGHEHGDEYIKNACEFIRSIYSDSPIFRIGGDEFVVVLEGKALDKRHDFIKKINEGLDKNASRTDEPWKRISLAYGMAIYDKKIDDDLDETIRRADEIMYAHKRQMKQKMNK